MNKFVILLVVAVFSGNIFAENSSDLYKKGAELASSGNFPEAKKIFERTIELSPYFSLAHYGLGKIYLYDGNDIETAIKELKTAVQLDNSFSKAHFYLGMAYMLDRKYVPAMKSFAAAYDRDSSYVEALYNIAVIYDLIGDSVKSAVYFDKYKRKLKEEQINFTEF
ncbi:MAG: tetratricopeptide repeat protein [Spirochaetes bacterium]|nr:tetratricopeptide repeat protein [Spirochaetota bacterium]